MNFAIVRLICLVHVACLLSAAASFSSSASASASDAPVPAPAVGVAVPVPSPWFDAGAVDFDHENGGSTSSSPSPSRSPSLVRFIVALNHRNLDRLERRFWQVSNPKSKHYRSFLSAEQIHSIVAPPTEAVEEVGRYFEPFAQSIRRSSTSIHIEMDVELASKLLKTEFHQVINRETGERVIRCRPNSYFLPPHIASHIHVIEGLTLDSFGLQFRPHPQFTRLNSNAAASAADQSSSSFSSLKHKAASARAPSSAAESGNSTRIDTITPQFLQSLYSFPSVNVSHPLPSPVSLGSAQFMGDYFPSDVNQFCHDLSLDCTTVSPSHVINGGQPASNYEGPMDIAWQFGINPQADVWYMESEPGFYFLGWAMELMNRTDFPTTISISYALDELHICDVGYYDCSTPGVNGSSIAYIQRAEEEFMKLGLRGISLLAASGDDGASPDNLSCTKPNGMSVMFPCSSPYITCVAATRIANPIYDLPAPLPPVCQQSNRSCISDGEEVAVDLVDSYFENGGGFSGFFPMPSYQVSAVNQYLQSGVQLPTSFFNRSNRAVPDVSAIGDKGYLIFEGSDSLPAGGTSLAGPVFAGVISILNSYLIAETGRQLGFLNPLLYTMAQEDPTTFHDIIKGSNKCTRMGCDPDTGCVCIPGCDGYVAAKGWDAVTGLGTPNFAAMLQYIRTHTHRGPGPRLETQR